jgi:hypothetical protein
MVLCAYSPSYLRGWGKRMAWSPEFEASLGSTVRLHLRERDREREREGGREREGEREEREERETWGKEVMTRYLLWYLKLLVMYLGPGNQVLGLTAVNFGEGVNSPPLGALLSLLKIVDDESTCLASAKSWVQTTKKKWLFFNQEGQAEMPSMYPFPWN